MTALHEILHAAKALELTSNVCLQFGRVTITTPAGKWIDTLNIDLIHGTWFITD